MPICLSKIQDDDTMSSSSITRAVLKGRASRVKGACVRAVLKERACEPFEVAT